MRRRIGRWMWVCGGLLPALRGFGPEFKTVTATNGPRLSGMHCAVRNPHFLSPIRINPTSPHGKIACSQLDLRASSLANRHLDPTAMLRTSASQALHNQRAQGAFFITAAVVSADCSTPPPPAKPPLSTSGKILSSSPAGGAHARSTNPSPSCIAPPDDPTARCENTHHP